MRESIIVVIIIIDFYLLHFFAKWNSWWKLNYNHQEAIYWIFLQPASSVLLIAFYKSKSLTASSWSRIFVECEWTEDEWRLWKCYEWFLSCLSGNLRAAKNRLLIGMQNMLIDQIGISTRQQSVFISNWIFTLLLKLKTSSCLAMLLKI